MTNSPTTTDALTCRELVELVTDYFEGRLAPADLRRFEDHLAACEPCTRYVEQLRITVTLVGRLAEEDLQPAARDAFLRAFRDWRSG